MQEEHKVIHVLSKVDLLYEVHTEMNTGLHFRNGQQHTTFILLFQCQLLYNVIECLVMKKEEN